MKQRDGGREHEASLIYVVGRVNQGIRREMRSRFAPWRLTVQEFTTLSVLSMRPGLSNAQLARRALVTPQSMIEILTKLELRGLVQRTIDPRHARVLRSELTLAGQEVVHEANPVIHAIQDEMPAAVPGREREAAMRAMRSAMESLTQRPKYTRPLRRRGAKFLVRHAEARASPPGT